ncbi:ABC transporter permease [Pedobacter cryoconitis]|uniref:ABC-type antimicrobial peptide transport system permease subunit n=1 Tax=Pedobacter cryoconitis TaxID=188932 RepID=A0A7X0J4X2_9SPHI|nr:ABC transporter permease [Pedobacter cryoconitis]MBB6501209.1 ABC-type antimicrobial peptide transport system permease subunit [Pedobacter cryoconitis]
MFKLNLKIAWRNLCKNKGYTLINIMGLSIAMASCILLFIFINYQLSFDKGYKNEDRIYRFVTNWKYNSYVDFNQGVPIPLVAAARAEFSGLEKVSAIASDQGIIQIKDQNGKDRIKTSEQVFYIEPDFFGIFNIGWLRGDPRKALTDPNTVALSEATAKKFFGTVENAMGKTILYGHQIPLKVTGVFKDTPENSSFPLKIVISYQSYWGKNIKSWDSVGSQFECYALFKEGTDLSSLHEPLKRFNKKYYEDKKIEGNQTNSFQSLKDIHFSEHYGNFANKFIAKSELYGLAVIGLFLIITACINFINLTTAQSINRSKEVGLRKVMGSKRKQLAIQFLTETFAITFAALLIACILAELAIPQLQNLFKEQISFSLFAQPIIFVFLAGLVIVVSLLAGLYPALIISGFNPALAIKNKITVNTGNLGLRKMLVILQFTITSILLIGTVVILQQMNYVKQKPLGFTTKAIVMVNVPTDSISKTKFNIFKQRALQISGVEMLSYCQRPPLSNDISSSHFSYNGQKNKDFEIRLSVADSTYFKLFGLKLIAGKSYLESDNINGYVVNETFLKKMNITNPQEVIGKILAENNHRIPIIGVVKDFNDRSLKEKISPMALYAQKFAYNTTAIKLDKNQIMPTMQKIEALWNTTFRDNIYEAKFVNDDINRYYESEQVMGGLFRIFAGVIIFISFIGLFGLISFVATQRTKEVAIRKVLGASTLELVKMLNGTFLLMVFTANIIAWPLAYIFVSKWLAGFAYRVDLSIWPFVSAFLISMTITLITVSIRSYKASVANTIDALKYE